MDDRCVVCGEAAVHVIDGDDGRRFPVCERHVLPAYRLELYLAVREVRQALLAEVERVLDQSRSQVIETASRRLGDIVADLRQRLPRRIEVVLSSKEQSELDGQGQ